MNAQRLPVGALVLLCSMVLLVSAARTATGQTLNFMPVGKIPGPVDLVRAQGHLAFVVESKTLAVFDVSNPATPTRVGQYTFPEEVWGFRIVGARAYVADGHTGLGILDISDPSVPTLISLFKTPGQVKNVSVAGNRALVANHMTGVDIVDISDPAKPSLLGSAFLDGYAKDVATVGSLAVAVDIPSGLYVFDMASANPLEPVASLQSAATPQQVEVSEIATARGAKIAVLAGSEPYDPLRAVRIQAGGKPRPGSIQVFDVSNPAAPVLTGAYPTSDSRRRIAIKGSLLYLADGPDGLRVLDLSVPSKATFVGSYKTAMPARDVAVADSLVFVVTGGLAQRSGSQGDGEILILRQTP